MKTLLLTLSMAMTVLAVTAQGTITSITPNSGAQNTQLTVQISGTTGSFSPGTSTYINFVQGSYSYFTAYTTNVQSSTSLSAVVNIPASAPTGLYDVSVSDYNGTAAFAQAAFTVLAGQIPHIVSVDTNYAAIGTTLDVTISGVATNFDQGTTTYISFSQGSSSYIPVNSVNVLDAHTILANISVQSNQPMGFYDLTTYDDWDGYLTLPNAFVVTDTAAGIVVVNPIDTTGNDSTTLRIIGSGTSFGYPGSTTVVWLGQTHRSSVPNALASSVNIINANTLEATFQFPAGSPGGWYDVYVLNSIDGELTKQHAYYKDGATGIKENTDDMIVLYPNPAHNQLNLYVKNTMINSDYEVIDLTGRVVMTGTLTAKVTPVSTGGLSSGVYLLRMGGQTYKFVKE
ncbi:MAG: T9SS type A sorting domain-containing protein [Bacteroidetes bacterium]|nr:T9SS type A sorting domain-containing protein [Bacteroidota bacterium]